VLAGFFPCKPDRIGGRRVVTAVTGVGVTNGAMLTALFIHQSPTGARSTNKSTEHRPLRHLTDTAASPSFFPLENRAAPRGCYAPYLSPQAPTATSPTASVGKHTAKQLQRLRHGRGQRGPSLGQRAWTVLHGFSQQ
jgi:hypothetical protein